LFLTIKHFTGPVKTMLHSDYLTCYLQSEHRTTNKSEKTIQSATAICQITTCKSSSFSPLSITFPILVCITSTTSLTWFWTRLTWISKQKFGKSIQKYLH